MKTLHGEKSALVLGAGGLGGPALLVLCDAGVGRMVFVEDGVVVSADLPWQPLYRESDVGERRSGAAAARLKRLFPQVAIEAIDGPLEATSATELTARADVVLDGSADFATKFLANDKAVACGKPLVHGGLVRSTAQILTVTPGTTGCLRCLFEAPPPSRVVPSCAEAGILGPLAGLAGALMGAEAVRLLSGERGHYAGRLTIYEARGARCRAVRVRPRPGCPTCGTAPIALAGAAGAPS